MKKTLIALVLAGSLATTSYGAGILIISEIVDGSLSGGLPKFVELSNIGDASVDLTQYSIGNYNNGGTTLGGGASTMLTGNLAVGASYVISYETGDSPGVGTFYNTYGFDPDNFDQGSFINGDDVVALFLGVGTGDGSDATLVDVYGEIGVDGTGMSWEYTDGYAFRLASVTGPNSTFTTSEWVFGGADSLEAATDAERLPIILANTSPGVFPNVIVPEPSTFVLAGFGMLGMFLARRRS